MISEVKRVFSEVKREVPEASDQALQNHQNRRQKGSFGRQKGDFTVQDGDFLGGGVFGGQNSEAKSLQNERLRHFSRFENGSYSILASQIAVLPSQKCPKSDEK